MNRKKGNIEILFVALIVLLFVLIVASIYLLFAQINYYIYPIKQDIFYIVQNSLLSFNKEELSYFDYKVNEEDLKERVNQILMRNHPNSLVESITYNQETRRIDITVSIKLSPIILSHQLGEIVLKIQDSIKFKNMEVENE